MNDMTHRDAPTSLLAQADWQHLEPIQLTPFVRRLTAPNPSVMTGPGTNSYIVGTADTGYIVIDPGPNDTDHVERLYDATAGDIHSIVCTHSHPDHSPAAKPLQALCRKSINSDPAIYGLPNGEGAELHSY
ncbi:MAG: MBL fold metallo-hydrolase, partial [Polaromonas sp.]|nr:MBL fold metallo-hydrolase [Polaromonas sp.]